MRVAAAGAIAAVVGISGCASSLREPNPLVAREAMSGRPAAELVRDADAAWALRPDPGAVARADALYSEAAMVDGEAPATPGAPASIDALVAAMRAKAWIVKHDADAARRERAAVSAVDAGLWCRRRQPAAALCDYWLGIALGMQAQEKTSTGESGMREMDKALRRAIAKEPGLEEGGPHRVRALLLLRAPGWPLGIGDADAGLEEAKAALALGPEHPHNHLVMAEALVATGDEAGAKVEFAQAIALAKGRLAGDPEAADWIKEATDELAKLSE